MHQFLTRSINRLVMGSFVFVLLLPLGFIISSLSQHSWDSAQNELKEKHLLIAKNMTLPVSQYFSSYQKNLNTFVNSTNLSTKNINGIKALTDKYVNTLDNFVAISFLSIEDGSSVVSVKDEYKIRSTGSLNSFPYHQTENKYRKYDTVNSISSVLNSSVSNKPVVLMKHHIIGKDLNKIGTIFVELDLAPVREMCNKIQFGEKGHCVIVDQLGQVVAHPSKELEQQIRDISSIGIMDKMKDSMNGLWTFHSPYLNEDVVVGYSTIEKLGWGVMILQPESELVSPFKEVINTVLTWLAVGIIISLLVAYILAQQITKPLNSLVVKSKEIGTRSDNFNLGKIPKNSPIEVSELWNALSALVSRLHKSNREVRKLNYSLSKDIEKATAKLRATNRYLYKMSSNDHLTKIANRRFFEDSVNKIIARKGKENVGIIVIDVDKFKFINDEYGHEAGDLALKHIATIMKESTRSKDIPARLGGDEFVVYINNCTDDVMLKIAENLRKNVQDQPILWEGTSIPLSLSVGTVNCPAMVAKSLDQLLKFADEAMYESKEAGRNHVSSYVFPGNAFKPKEVNKKPLPVNKTLDKEAELQKKELEALLDDLPHKPEDLTDEILSVGAEKKKEKPKNIWITAK
ncbi:sensor domain-containing diguanylate cyclase [Cocleimonas flava]|uniref:Diguanylate cyclase (GGDEF)-like protein n=1 Tax=Cocleimonas flava TaxID=634765 RepID=A0A4R1F8Q8_9GAMM|nr:sensor domain-containing diguanylate cyclase [Cocleimonas flava]TCJ89124.1 diguanylate cyclase (GGDEF)-like protein [Cocleimonas flava]